MKLRHRIGEWLLRDAPPREPTLHEAMLVVTQRHGSEREALILAVRPLRITMKDGSTMILLPNDVLSLRGEVGHDMRATLVIETHRSKS